MISNVEKQGEMARFWELCDRVHQGFADEADAALVQLREIGADVAVEGDAVVATFGGVAKHLTKSAKQRPEASDETE